MPGSKKETGSKVSRRRRRLYEAVETEAPAEPATAEMPAPPTAAPARQAAPPRRRPSPPPPAEAEAAPDGPRQSDPWPTASPELIARLARLVAARGW